VNCAVLFVKDDWKGAITLNEKKGKNMEWEVVFEKEYIMRCLSAE
jgi:hypothetical protein